MRVHIRPYIRALVIYHVQKRKTLLWPRSHHYARRHRLSRDRHPSGRITITLLGGLGTDAHHPKPPPIRPGLHKTAIVFPINYIAPSSSLPSSLRSLRARTCSRLGHGLNTMDRREVQSHQTQRRDLRADNRFEKLSRTPDWRIAVFVVNQNAWFTCIVNLALCTSHTSCLYMYNQLPPRLRIVSVA